jgi:hypothetical protein
VSGPAGFPSAAWAADGQRTDNVVIAAAAKENLKAKRCFQEEFGLVFIV